MQFSCFKAYDIRGRLPDELNEEIAWRIGRAYAAYLKPKRVVIGRDVRPSSVELARSLARGLTEGGADVVDIGLCGTEEIYFVTDYGRFDGGIMVTASHNPADWNGMKLVREQARPISGDSGLNTIRELAEKGEFPAAERTGTVETDSFRGPYIRHLLGYLDSTELLPLKIVVNPGNGCAGPVVRLLEAQLPFEMVPVHFEPDGAFPNGIPNPLLPENRAATADAVRAHGADLGVAWDGDFDRCFLFDERGEFIEGYYIVGLLAEFLLGVVPGAKIIHDPRLTWNTIDIVQRAGGTPIQSKTGHAFIKERMRSEDALYGGEMSAHHYFRNFAYCDSGMIPWLLVAGLMCRTGKKLSELVEERIALFPASGEINRTVQDVGRVLAAIEQEYGGLGGRIDRTDGLSIEFDDWRFNLRPSNTEPVLRLNVEARGDRALMERKTGELLQRIDAIG
ncbi:MAG: colanic acid biosynthesis phosphomannomutase CpsG [Geothermobacteraceae bacterium]